MLKQALRLLFPNHPAPPRVPQLGHFSSGSNQSLARYVTCLVVQLVLFHFFRGHLRAGAPQAGVSEVQVCPLKLQL